MIYLYLLEKKSDTDVIVRGQHHAPFDPVDGLGKTEVELSKQGYLVESLPTPIEGKKPILHINPTNKEVWYTYEEIQIPKEQTIEELKAKIDLIQSAMDDLILVGGAL